jgi:two-component system OmpR family sensor kinase
MSSIQRQLLLGLTLGILLATGSAGVAIYYSARIEANDLFDYQLRQAAMSLPAHLNDESFSQSDGLGEEIVVQVWSKKEKLIYSSNPPWSLPRYKQQGFHTVNAFDMDWRIYSENRRKNFVQIAQPISVRDYLAASFAIRSLIPFFLLIPVILLLAGVIVKRRLQPLQHIAQAMEARTATDLQPLPMQNLPSEVATITHSLNDLLARLNKALSAQRAFIADAAHELRSPLTALKLQLQLAERAKTETQRTQAISKLHERLNRTIYLVEQMLTLARHEAAQGMTTTAVALGALVQQVMADYVNTAANAEIQLGADLPTSEVWVQGHPQNLAIMLKNLLENALHYTPAGGAVIIQVTLDAMDETHPVLRVTDTGGGIPAAERERVFNRFYRCADNAVPGTGLGLAIVRNIVDQHQAQIILADNPQTHGLQVSVIFPQSCSKS